MVLRDPLTAIRDFHAHIYFNPDELDKAKRLADELSARFPVDVGYFHTRPVGPHPRGSCQVTLAPRYFGEIVQWLSLNHGGLTIFVHPSTGDDRADHLDHAMWIGESEILTPPPGYNGS